MGDRRRDLGIVVDPRLSLLICTQETTASERAVMLPALSSAFKWKATVRAGPHESSPTTAQGDGSPDDRAHSRATSRHHLRKLKAGGQMLVNIGAEGVL